jgi:hypothetical protein
VLLTFLHGRLDDVSTDGLALIEEIRLIYDNYGYETQILAASVRHTMHIVNCAKIGADVMTGPLSAIYGLLKHPLTDIDWRNLLISRKEINKKSFSESSFSELNKKNPISNLKWDFFWLVWLVVMKLMSSTNFISFPIPCFSRIPITPTVECDECKT